MAIEFRHLRYFVAIVEEGGFSEAARNRLYTSQSSLSRQIQEIETELGVTLLVRGVHGVKPTEAGEMFFHHARGLLRQLELAIDATRQAKDPLRVGCLPGIEQHVLQRLREFHASGVLTNNCEVFGFTSPVLRTQIREGRLDVAFAWLDEDALDLEFVEIFRPEIIALLAAGHLFSQSRTVKLEALKKEIMIAVSPKTEPNFWPAIDAQCRLRGLILTPAHFAVNLTSAISLILSTGGFILVPDFVRNLIPATIAAVTLDSPPSGLPICLFYRPASRSSVGTCVESIVKHWNTV